MGVLSLRSTALKALDLSIANYNKMPSQPNLFAIATALSNWERSRTSGTPSGRNEKGAITALKGELKSKGATFDDFRNQTMNPQELQSLKFVHEQRQRVLQTVFAHADVVFVGNKLDKGGIQTLLQRAGAKSVGQNAIVGKVKEVMQEFKQQLLDMATAFFETGMQAAGEVGQWVLNLITEIAATVAPYIGHILDAKQMVVGWINVGKSIMAEARIAARSYVIDTGSPRAAFQGLLQCMRTETQKQAAAAGIATASFVAKTGAAFLDLGTVSGVAIGIVKALGEFARQLLVLASEWKAINALKKILQSGRLDITVFKTYPLLGAYMLTSATLSDVIPIENFGTPGWMDQTESMKREFDLVLKEAESLIQKSKFVVTGLVKRHDLVPQGSTTGNMMIGFSNAGISLVKSITGS
jgi:hypothetical protein